MKKIFALSILAMGLIFSLACCDQVEPPYYEGGNNIIETDTVRKVLLEDFTGHRCVYCPDGHEEAEALKKAWGKQLIVVAIHAGTFADTFPVAPWNYNFVVQEGEDIYNHFNVSGLPKGIINRVPKPGSSNVVLAPGDWSSQVGQLVVPKDPDAYIHIDVSYNQASHSIDIETETTFFTPNTNSENYKLVVQITEDSIIKPQEHHDHGVILDYEHNHVLRKVVNTTWGESLHSGPVGQDQKFLKDYTNVSLKADWVAEKCNVVAYIYYDGGTMDKQIIQAQEVKLIP